MTTPKQDLTVEQIENFRSYCHAYLEKIGPTHGLVDCVCDLARKSIEAQKQIEALQASLVSSLEMQFCQCDAPSIMCDMHGIRCTQCGKPERKTTGYQLTPTPQKPEPSGEREDDERSDCLFPGCDCQDDCDPDAEEERIEKANEPSPTPGDR